MGITGELVRSIFSRNRSTQDSNAARSYVADKKRWSSVRSYLCGDEFNSVLAEEDSTSFNSSEAAVIQTIPEGLRDQGENQSDETKPNIPDEKHNSISKQLHEEDAAMVIQSAFRHFLARRQNTEMKTKDDKQEPLTGNESPSRESIGTSIEVQTGNSMEVFSVQEESNAVHHRVQQKPKAQVLRIKEDWDDSTVSSNISKMRIQNKLEAMTRRERALAYAFSQQLRTCSKRKQAKPDGKEQNLSWGWVERWMATLVPASSLVEKNTSKQFEPVDYNRRFVVRKGIIDVIGEEEESCGSNEVSVRLESLSVTTPKEIDGYRPSKNMLEATRSISRRKTVPSYQLSKESGKVKGLRASD
ncbi:protein IQ-DOMAIN 1-like [Durio zibethinus]|uniref:Protein IQ-DOMAIN 1-like n=1 Tax=Durio zibethinus TaxID=66656 RepID=A0A6P6B470_DURZI|nr:protein IQ-DOMAIN 1-like [Durio zibethinus]